MNEQSITVTKNVDKYHPVKYEYTTRKFDEQCF